MQAPFLIYPIAGVLIGLVIIILKRTPGLMQQAKFQKMGSMAGKTKQDIISTVGNFSSITHLDDGGQICVWQTGSFMITIQFNKDGKFIKILSQTVVK